MTSKLTVCFAAAFALFFSTTAFASPREPTEHAARERPATARETPARESPARDSQARTAAGATRAPVHDAAPVHAAAPARTIPPVKTPHSFGIGSGSTKAAILPAGGIPRPRPHAPRIPIIAPSHLKPIPIAPPVPVPHAPKLPNK